MPARRVVRRFGSATFTLVVATLALFLAPTHAFAGLAVGTPAALDPVKINAVRTQESVAGAASLDVTLFAWTDSRSGNHDVYAARVRNDGMVLDPNGIAVAATDADDADPTVSWNGTNWLVVWQRNGSAIYATRIAENGEVLDPSPIMIADGPFSDHAPAAAGLGDGHLIVWSSGDLAFSIYGALVGSDGSFLVSPVALAGGTNHETAPAVAVNEPTALVAFQSDRNGNADIYGFRLEREASGPPALVRVDATDFAISVGTSRKSNPAVGARVDGWLVAWEDSRNSATTGLDIYASRIDAAGIVQDPAGTNLTHVVGSGTDERDPAVRHNGANWIVAYSRTDVGQFYRKVGNNGGAIGVPVVVSNASGTLGKAAFGGEPYRPIIAWSAPEVGTSAPKPPQDIVGMNLNLVDDPPGPQFTISTQTPNQTQPALAFGGNRWFMAWVDDRYGPTEGRLRYAVTDSARFEAPSLVSFVAVRPGLDQQQPTATFDGTNFNLFWTEDRGGHRAIVGARFTTGGGLIDTFVVAAGAWNHLDPTAQHVDDGVNLVAWTDERAFGDRNVWGIRVQNGAVLGAEAVLANTPGVQDEQPQLPSHIVDRDTDFTFLVWQKRVSPTSCGISGRFVFLNPLSFTSEEIVRFEADRVFEQPQIAWNGDSWIVTYQERIDNDGAALYVPWGTWIGGSQFCFVCGSDQLGPGSYVPGNPTAMTNGYNFLALWSRLEGSQVDLQMRRTNVNSFDYPDAAPIAYTNDPEVDVPGAGLKGQLDRMGFTYLRGQNDEEWQGLRLFGADARDTLIGRVVINEFSAHPPMGVPEFIEYYNTTGQDFQLRGWKLRVDGFEGFVAECNIITSRTPPGDELLGKECGQLDDHNFYFDQNFTGLPESGTEGFLPDRGARIELVAPGGVVVDVVGYGFRGGAPVMPPLPIAIAPSSRVPGNELLAPGDSVEVSTARLPNGGDTGNDANDFNSTTNSTAGTTNVGTAAQLGSSLFTTRLFWNPPAGSVDALELFNPTANDIDFTNWYLGSNDGTQRIGVPGSLWSLLKRAEKRVLRRGEPGAFSTDLDYLTVVYLYMPDFTRVEQIGWSRADNQQPQQCMNREPETGGFHDGFDWFTSGGQENLFAGELRYATCSISSPGDVVDTPGAIAPLAFRGAVPNPSSARGGALVFSVPGVRSGDGVAVRLRLIDVAGRVRSTLVDGALAPGEHRVPLSGNLALGAGVYYAELEVGGQRLSRPIVIVP